MGPARLPKSGDRLDRSYRVTPTGEPSGISSRSGTDFKKRCRRGRQERNQWSKDAVRVETQETLN